MAERRDISVELESLIAATKERPVGVTISHDEIERTTGIVKDARGWAALIKQWKKQMTILGRWIKAVPRGSGYRFLPEQEQASEVLRIAGRSERCIDQGVICGGIIDQTKLSDRDREMLNGSLGHLTTLKQTFTRQKAERRLWLTRKEPNPRLSSPQNGEDQS